MKVPLFVPFACCRGSSEMAISSSIVRAHFQKAPRHRQ
jgi:hypothetical protein